MKLIWRCALCLKDLKITGSKGNTRYCPECKRTKRNKSRHAKHIHKEYIPMTDKLLYILKKTDCNLGMIVSFTGCSENSMKSMMVTLRKKGHHIVNIDGDFYHYEGLIQ